MNVKFNIEIDTSNDSVQDDPRAEVQRILAHITDQVVNRGLRSSGSVRDINGNAIGSWLFDCEDE